MLSFGIEGSLINNGWGVITLVKPSKLRFEICSVGDLSHLVLKIDTGIVGGLRDKEYGGDLMLGRIS